MSDYTEAAPLLSKAIGVTKFKTDHPEPVAVAPVVDKAPTITKTIAVYDALLNLEGNNGYRGIRRMTGVSVRWIKVIHAEMLAAKGAVYAEVEPV